MTLKERLAAERQRWNVLSAYQKFEHAVILVLTALIAVVVWRTAQTTAIVRRAIDRVALAQNMTPVRSGPVGTPLISPSRLRTYSLRTALIFVVMINRALRRSLVASQIPWLSGSHARLRARRCR